MAALTGARMDVEQLMSDFELMVLIRQFETETERQYKAANIGGYCHLSSGQEATTVGVVGAMHQSDLLVTGYRCHGFALARGVSADAVMAELFGRETGCAHGRGGSMHLLDIGRGYYGGWGIVAGQMPVAIGLALGLVRQQREHAVVCELGDGAVNMGAWHESLNLASLWRLPVIFVVVNNTYGMGTAVERASAEPEAWRRASAYRMAGERVDGNDLPAIREAASRLLDDARRLRQPAVLELTTYRYRGHSVADAGLAYRSREEIATHEQLDPLILAAELLRTAAVTEAELEAVQARAQERVDQAVAYAAASPEPALSRLAAGMHCPGSDEQFAPMRAGAAFGEVQLTFDAGLGA